MKVLFLLAAIVIFIIVAILAFAGGTYATFDHLFGLLSVGLAVLTAWFLPIP